MAFDEALAERVHGVLGDAPDVVARRMFGGIAFMVAGNMACGVMGEDLMVRVGKAAQAACLALPHARPMELSGREMGGFVVVDAEGLDEDDVLEGWVERGSAYAASLPPRWAARSRGFLARRPAPPLRGPGPCRTPEAGRGRSAGRVRLRPRRARR